MKYSVIFPREDRIKDLTIIQNILEDLGYEYDDIIHNKKLDNRQKIILFDAKNKKYHFLHFDILPYPTDIYMRDIKSGKKLKEILIEMEKKYDRYLF